MIKEQNTKRKTAKKNILIIMTAILLSFVMIVGMCLFVERPAVREIAVYQSAFPDTLIRAAKDGAVEIFPQDSKDTKTGIIFYVGAQIRPSAYIPLLARLSEKGYTCFIPELSFNTALLEPNAAEAIIEAHPEIESWIMAGHSLGGLTAAGYTDDHRGEIDGLVFIAAYTNRDMSESELSTLSVFGDADGVLNRNRYEERKAWNSKDFEEHIIAGANHAQYGDYGEQPRDNDALITADEQQRQTAEIIFDWLTRHVQPGGGNE